MKKLLAALLVIAMLLSLVSMVSCEKNAPDPSDPDTTEPGTTDPDTSEPDINEPDTKEPGKDEPDDAPTATINNIDDWDKLAWSAPHAEGEQMNAPYAYALIENFVSGTSSVPEFNELGIRDYSVTLLCDDGDVCDFQFTFTVTGGSLIDTLPQGKHTFYITDTAGDGVTMTSVRPDHGVADQFEVDKYYRALKGLDKFGSSGAAQAVSTYLDYNNRFEIPDYGCWDENNISSARDYIIVFCSKDQDHVVTPDEITRLLEEKFGYTGDSSWISTEIVEGWLQTLELFDNTTHHRITDVTEEDGVTTVTVQLFADRFYHIPSHKLVYKLDENLAFLGCEIVEESMRKPRTYVYKRYPFPAPQLIRTIDDLADWDKLALPHSEMCRDLIEVFLSSDGDAYEKKVHGYKEPVGLYDSYNDLRFGEYTITVDRTEEESGWVNIYLTVDVLEGTDAIPTGENEFIYDEFYGALSRVSRNVAQKSDAYKELVRLTDWCANYDFRDIDADWTRLSVTEYIIHNLGSKRASADEISAYAEKYLGIKDFVPSESCRDGDEFTIFGHGGSWLFRDEVSTVYDESADEYTVTVRYYADEGKTVFSHLMAYRMKFDGEHWIFLDFEVLSEGEFAPAVGTI